MPRSRLDEYQALRDRQLSSDATPSSEALLIGASLLIIIDSSTLVERQRCFGSPLPHASVPFWGRTLPIGLSLFTCEGMEQGRERFQNNTEEASPHQVVEMLLWPERAVLLFD